jgi:hypothetical protein
MLLRYHVPRSWLKPKQNLLVIFEELGGDASKISLVKRSTTSVCADAFEHHPTIENYNTESNGESERNLHQAKVHLRCAPGQSISAIKFASFGTPTGTCGSFQEGTCHAPNSHSVVEKVDFLSRILLSFYTSSYLISFSFCFIIISLPVTNKNTFSTDLMLVPLNSAEMHRKGELYGRHIQQ